MKEIKYTPKDISHAIWLEFSSSKSANPYQHLTLYREGLREAFGPESPIFQNISAGIFFALSQASMGHYVVLSDLYDIEDFALQMAKEKPADLISNFVYGYIVGLTHVELACDNINDCRTIIPVASRLLRALTSPKGSYNF